MLDGEVSLHLVEADSDRRLPSVLQPLDGLASDLFDLGHDLVHRRNVLVANEHRLVVLPADAHLQQRHSPTRLELPLLHDRGVNPPIALLPVGPEQFKDASIPDKQPFPEPYPAFGPIHAVMVELRPSGETGPQDCRSGGPLSKSLSEGTRRAR